MKLFDTDLSGLILKGERRIHYKSKIQEEAQRRALSSPAWFKSLSPFFLLPPSTGSPQFSYTDCITRFWDERIMHVRSFSCSSLFTHINSLSFFSFFSKMRRKNRIKPTMKYKNNIPANKWCSNLHEDCGLTQRAPIKKTASTASLSATEVTHTSATDAEGYRHTV